MRMLTLSGVSISICSETNPNLWKSCGKPVNPVRAPFPRPPDAAIRARTRRHRRLEDSRFGGHPAQLVPSSVSPSYCTPEYDSGTAARAGLDVRRGGWPQPTISRPVVRHRLQQLRDRACRRRSRAAAVCLRSRQGRTAILDSNAGPPFSGRAASANAVPAPVAATLAGLDRPPLHGLGRSCPPDARPLAVLYRTLSQ